MEHLQRVFGFSLVLILVLMSLTLVACQSAGATTMEDLPTPIPTPSRSEVLILADLNEDVEESVQDFQPMADYMAAHLGEFGISAGKVVVAPDMETMTELLKNGESSYKTNKILERVLTLAYYFDWPLKKDEGDFEKDYFVEIPNNFLIRLKERFNLEVLSTIYENDDFFMFLNAKGKIVSVFKNFDEFSKVEIEKVIIPALKKVFGVKKIIVEK